MPYAEVNGTRLWFVEAGEGRAVLLLHSSLADGRSWEDVVPLLAGRYRVVAPDLRGFGRSEHPTAPYSDVEDLAALLDALAIDLAAVVGNSHGGRVAIDFAVARPERVWALVPVGAGLGGFDGSNPYTDEQDAEQEAAFERGELECVVEIDLEVWAPLGPTARMLELARANAHVSLFGEDVAARALEPPAAARLSEITVPTLVVDPEHDVERMHAIAQTLAEQIPGARLVTLAGADHLVPLRTPAELARVVGEFLDSV